MPDAHALARLATLAHTGLPDHTLLDRFAADRDECAFAALVERHGPVVLDVARAVLRHAQDAEDVFQASFLVLARNASTIRTRTSVGCWLHGVARRLALKALRARARRSRHEAVPRVAALAPGDELTWGEVRALIHDELAQLPDALRAPVLLCHLEGLTIDEAAARLALPRGTLRDRLDRGRAVLRKRLAQRGLAVAAIAFPTAISNAVPPLTVLGTARSAIRFASGIGDRSRAAELANGAMPAMIPARFKLGLLFAITFGAVGLVVAGIRDVEAPAVEVPGEVSAVDPPDAPPPEVVRADLPVAPPPAAAPRIGFESITVVIKPPGLSNQPGATIRISSDGSCLCEIPGRIPPGGREPLLGARLVHKLPLDRLRTLNELLKDTDWLKKDAKDVMRLHAAEYAITLEQNIGQKNHVKRTLKIAGESEVYPKVLHFFDSIAHQEHLLYRLEWVPETMADARRDLDNIIGGELGELIGRSQYVIDLTRFTPWAKRTVRNSFNKQVDEVRVAVRLIGLLKLESEREHVNDLATDRDSSVRSAVALAVARLGGEKAVPVLRKMLRSTSEAPWELIKLGAIAVPTIAEVIRDGGDPNDMGYEHLIRAYIDNWKNVPLPFNKSIADAVKAGMVSAKEKAVRTQYHAELLKLIEAPPPPEDPKLGRARTDVLNLANAIEAFKAKTGVYPEKLAALKDSGFVAPDTSLRDPWGSEYRYDPMGTRNSTGRSDVWTVSPDKVEIGNWAADLWGEWGLLSLISKPTVREHWEFGANMIRVYKLDNTVYRGTWYTLDASQELKQINLVIDGVTHKGIYEVKGDTLRVSHGLSDKDERPKDFEGGEHATVLVFKRQK
ncbi:sigma-70 family rna polymerase sigma factor : RNA polymerase sigma factor, sigma-70 family OS=Singulisphaera acidiphila (strain ATCC BAA-1392 / DSM 18658 / VKM B-2454 / MOB10) GN=Sinac_5383 PE=4 SV=1: Sigma70_r2: Sigma70_r4_2: HEAT_2: T2SG [Gemmata massiliana]|uniref:ECF RNA polymerase sigma factor SigE n=1 Tax=Gemmata massiliana TaxID=1210884 RepID=A0A6P2CZ26_9BACT|nr:sigma-70 family RNA polymerase sigma factor [Gemmata massiliana]VTR93817.1 sigma-70 family rna polymerase sigma factor : RNA polymerase sigma factor, sigma-70 family OS=Singulisphaera acidiphila (strain ATCC BAA-1392 / DSM 18658 / VKM B-2454 / MOB10) GN=Sinac_5383 PE=4 SV=1: Sigma70_r2: Sigma70_r4_2: HEAT_2: T2SG [Gemmata massiliana]